MSDRLRRTKSRPYGRSHIRSLDRANSRSKLLHESSASGDESDISVASDDIPLITKKLCRAHTTTTITKSRSRCASDGVQSCTDIDIADDRHYQRRSAQRMRKLRRSSSRHRRYIKPVPIHIDYEPRNYLYHNSDGSYDWRFDLITAPIVTNISLLGPRMNNPSFQLLYTNSLGEPEWYEDLSYEIRICDLSTLVWYVITDYDSVNKFRMGDNQFGIRVAVDLDEYSFYETNPANEMVSIRY